jgi:glycosyltransferase involved in cell wall biosynthesis
VKIIVYDDNPDFGGHQIMTGHGIEALASNPSNEILCMINPDNRQLAEKLAAIESCQTLEIPCSTRRLQGVLNHVDHRGIKRLHHLFGQLQADLLLCIQGDIEHSSQALIAANRLGLKCISYIALPHCLATMGVRLGAWRDALNHGLFRQPSRYIAISESMAGLLRARGVKQRIDIVPNGIAMPPTPGPMRQERRAVLGMLGRVEFKQKRQDFMVRAFCAFPQAFENCRLLIAGDGSDRNALEHLVVNGPRKADIDLHPWQHDIDAFFASIDMLVIPSRYEGVPLVMLEALARGIPVIGSNRDGMKEILPESWGFETENAASMAETFSCIRSNWQNDIDPLRKRILANHSLEAFKTNFANAVLRRF